MIQFPIIDLTPSTGVSLISLETHFAESTPSSFEQMDVEVARQYIRTVGPNPKSVANSQKELYRFLAWCRIEVKKGLQQLNVADLNAYKEFLHNPPPAWISRTKWPRNDPRYRPLSGPLSDASRCQAIIAVKALFSFAEQIGYLKGNTAALFRNVSKPARDPTTRYLDANAVALAVETVSRRVPDSEKSRRQRERDHFLLIAFANTGARLSEIVDANMGAIYPADAGRWWFDIAGDGRRPRRVPVPDNMLEAFARYREAFGLPRFAERWDSMPLVLASTRRARERITDEAASNAIKSIFAEAAAAATLAGDHGTASTLRLASAHWLRHGLLIKHASNGVALKTLQQTAGHASITTTAAYLNKADNERHDEIIESMSTEQRD